MSLERTIGYWQTLEGEYAKTAVEAGLHLLTKSEPGNQLIDKIRGGERIYDERLFTDLAGLALENPVMLGAGWDKKGWVVDAVHGLGFSADEVGSVPLYPQPGNDRPRLFYDRKHHVSLNSFGFNSVGAAGVANYLASQKRFGKVGISLTKNKNTLEDDVVGQMAETARDLREYADYYAINFSSPNTPGLREMILRQLREAIREVKRVQMEEGGKYQPIFIKLTVDMPEADVFSVIEICDEEGAAGIIDSNSTNNSALKAKYDWADKPGGLTGNDPDYRGLAEQRMLFITRQSRGTKLVRIGVGAIGGENITEVAIRRMRLGAQAVQVVTAMREHKLQPAQKINQSFLDLVEKEGLKNISEIVGADC